MQLELETGPFRDFSSKCRVDTASDQCTKQLYSLGQKDASKLPGRELESSS